MKQTGHMMAWKMVPGVPRTTRATVTTAFSAAVLHRTPTGARGFTLVEALIAAAIGAVIFTSLYSGISNSFSLLNTARANLRATQIMVSRLEGLRLCAWGNGTNQISQLFDTNVIPSTFTDYFYPEGMNGNSTNYGTTYSGTMTVSTNFTLNPPANYSSRMARVTVTVTWKDGVARRAVAHTRSMSTYVAQFGEQNYIFNH
jgi:prepilin-type N-terminal cleavage/methylation domain-containing protein